MFIDSYVFLFLVVVFFFKQKTAYEMRISDWSSDVCSSDLSRDRDRRLYRCAIHRDDAPRRSAGRRAALSRDALRLLRVDDRRGRAGDQSLSVEPGPGPRADAADHLRLAVQPAPADGIVVVDVHPGGGVPARRSEERRVGKEGVSPGRTRWSPAY